MSRLIVSRTAWCSHCHRAGKPQREDLYITWGTTHQALQIHWLDHNVPFFKKGYVPHLFEKIATQSLDSGVYVHVIKTCGMNDCGVYLSALQIKGEEVISKGTWDYEGKQQPYYVHRKRWTKFMIKERDWIALVNFKNTGYELDDEKY